jgi:hypothetical protein
MVVGYQSNSAYSTQLEEGGLVALEEQTADDGVGVNEGF